jgi:hypothetical protein
MDQFEAFETQRFVGRLLGRGDVSGLMDKIQVSGWSGFDEFGFAVLHHEAKFAKLYGTDLHGWHVRKKCSRWAGI